jgi:hypothetical protein
MPRDGSLVLSDARAPTLTIVCEPCGRRGQYMLMRGQGESYSDAIIRIARGLVRLAAPLLIMAALFGAQIIAKEISRGRALAD